MSYSDGTKNYNELIFRLELLKTLIITKRKYDSLNDALIYLDGRILNVGHNQLIKQTLKRIHACTRHSFIAKEGLAEWHNESLELP